MSKPDSMKIGPTTAQVAAGLVREPYAWPGGYPRYAQTVDGGCLCVKCCEAEAARLADVDPDCPDDQQWAISCVTVNWEQELYCDHCGGQIESAYEPREDGIA